MRDASSFSISALSASSSLSSGALRARSSKERLIVHRTSRGSLVACATAACSLLLIAAPLTVPAQAADGPVVDPAIARSPELSETTRLSDRRFVVTGDRAWALGTADGRYPAAGFHTRGEMGGFWLPNLKLLDGMWFGINGDWIGPATKTTSGWGYVRTDLPVTNGVAASRTDFVPDGVSGALVGLSLRANRTRTITLTGRRPLRAAWLLPVGRDQPQPDRGEPAGLVRGAGTHLVFRDRGTPPQLQQRVATTGPPRSASTWPRRTPRPARTSAVRRSPAVICPASGPNAPPQPERCDDTEYGKGVGGQLTYSIQLRAGEVRTVWFGVGGSTAGPDEARDQLAGAPDRPGRRAGRQGGPADPDRPAYGRRPAREPAARRTACAGPSRCWPPRSSESSNARLREVNAGQNYPPPVAHAGPHALARRRLARLHLAVRHRRRVHRVRRGRGRAVRRRSRTICGRCATCRWRSTATAARSCTR